MCWIILTYECLLIHCHLGTISWETLKISVLDMSLKITNSRLQPHLPEADELTLPVWKILNSALLSYLWRLSGKVIMPNMDSHSPLPETSFTELAFSAISCKMV